MVKLKKLLKTKVVYGLIANPIVKVVRYYVSPLTKAKKQSGKLKGAQDNLSKGGSSVIAINKRPRTTSLAFWRAAEILSGRTPTSATNKLFEVLIKSIMPDLSVLFQQQPSKLLLMSRKRDIE